MTSEICVLGIDPGLTGALAFYFPSAPERVAVHDMPVVDGEINVAALAARVRQMAPTHGIVELVGPQPKDGSRQAFRFGGSYHAARAVLTLLEVPHSLVTPQTWKRSFRLGGGTDGKEAARGLALRLFPACAEHFQLVKHHNRAEAALLARWGAEQVLGSQAAARSGCAGDAGGAQALPAELDT